MRRHLSTPPSTPRPNATDNTPADSSTPHFTPAHHPVRKKLIQRVDPNQLHPSQLAQPLRRNPLMQPAARLHRALIPIAKWIGQRHPRCHPHAHNQQPQPSTAIDRIPSTAIAAHFRSPSSNPATIRARSHRSPPPIHRSPAEHSQIAPPAQSPDAHPPIATAKPGSSPPPGPPRSKPAYPQAPMPSHPSHEN